MWLIVGFGLKRFIPARLGPEAKQYRSLRMSVRFDVAEFALSAAITSSKPQSASDALLPGRRATLKVANRSGRGVAWGQSYLMPAEAVT
jgi:hypothetical protein